MDTTLQTGGDAKRPHLLLASLWGGFVVLALVIETAVGCPVAGCRSAAIALVAGLTLALGLGALMTHSDRLAAHHRLDGKH